MVIGQTFEAENGDVSSVDIPFLLFGDFNETEFGKYLKPNKAVKMTMHLAEDQEQKEVPEPCGKAIENVKSDDSHVDKDKHILCDDELRREYGDINKTNQISDEKEDICDSDTGSRDSPAQVNNNAAHQTKNEKNVVDNGTKIARQKPQTWAALFKSTTPVQSSKAPTIVSVQVDQSVKNESKRYEEDDSERAPMTTKQLDENARHLADFLQKANLHYGSTFLQLRGLINNGNWCYINATLQSLLGCPAFLHLFKSMSPFKQKPSDTSSVPLTYTMIDFVNEFPSVDPKAFNIKGKKVEDLKLGSSFEPKQVYEILSVLKTTLCDSGKQQDAEEFLTFLLNGLHEEFASLCKLPQNSPKGIVKHSTEKLVNGIQHDHSTMVVDSDKSKDDDHADNFTDDWEQVGRNNKTALLRKTSENETLITKLFGGVIRSSVQHSGAKESATLQPFFTIQLDIQAENIWNIKDAFENYFTKESLEGFTSSKTNSEVEASHKTSLEKLPRVLILHLKYFVYDKTGGCQKTHKAIEIIRELEIPTDVLSPSLRGRVPSNHRKYELFAIEFHHGKNAAGGHYTTAVKHKAPIGWVYCNDNVIQKAQANQIFKPHKEKVPYLLFYERNDGK